MEPIADGAVHACIGWLLPATGTLVFSVMGSEAIHTPVPADELELDLQPTRGADRPVLVDVTYRNGIGTVPLWKMRATLQESWGAEAHGTNSVLRFRGERVGSSQVNLYGEASQPTYEHGCGTYPTAAGEVSPTVEVKTVQAGTTVPVPWKTAIDPRGGRDATVPVELISQSSTPTVSGESIAATEPGIYVVDQVFAGVDGSEYRKWTVVEALTAEDWAAYQTDPDEQSTVPIPEGPRWGRTRPILGTRPTLRRRIRPSPRTRPCRRTLPSRSRATTSTPWTRPRTARPLRTRRTTPSRRRWTPARPPADSCWPAAWAWPVPPASSCCVVA